MTACAADIVTIFFVQVKDFFPDLDIDRVKIIQENGRAKGEAFVVFKSTDHAKEAIKKDKEKMGERWIDLFLSTRGEMYLMTATGAGGKVSSKNHERDRNTRLTRLDTSTKLMERSML